MSKAEKTREYIIEKAAPLFNKKGYAGTSLNDLIEVTGLTKGSIYGNFENKDDVAVAVYKYNVSSLYKRLTEFLQGKETATEKLIGFTEYYRTSWKKISERGGCPFLNASIEADDNLGFLKKTVQESIKNWARRLAGIIESGKQSGEFKKNISSEEYAYSIISMLEGGVMLAKIMNDPKFLFNALDRICAMINNEIKK